MTSNSPEAAGGAHALQKILVWQGRPRRALVARVVAHAVGAHGVAVKIGDALALLGQPRVESLVGLLAQHRLDLARHAVVVAFPVALEGTTHEITVQVHRAQLSRGTRHRYHEYCVAADLVVRHVGLAKQVGADTPGVIRRIPQLLLELRDVFRRKAGGVPGTVPSLAHAAHDATAIGVGHGRVTLPQRLRETSFGFLDLEAVALAVRLELAEVELHAHAPRITTDTSGL